MLFIEIAGVIEAIFLGEFPGLELRSYPSVDFLDIPRDLVQHVLAVLDNPLLFVLKHQPCLFELITQRVILQ